MRQRLALILMSCILLSACANPLASSPTQEPSNPPGAPTAAPNATAAASAPTSAAAPTTAESDPTAAPAAPTSAATKASFAPADCKFEKPSGVDVSCGYLTVPEDRGSAGGKTIKLHVAVFKSTSKNPAPDPVVYLEGGPGGHSLETVPLTYERWFAPFAEDRDFIMLDQRGIGYSEPSLDCPELLDLYYETLDKDISAEESSKLNTQAALKCRDRLAGQGVNLAAFNDHENAADLNDLRIALGYEQWNLYGISYGTQLALTTMRDFPQGIRSVVLDSTVPLQTPVDLDVPANADRALNTLFDGCAKDAACNQAYPNLKDKLYGLVDQLNQKPVTEEVSDSSSGKQYKVLLNGDTLLSTVFNALYVSAYIPLLPKAIDNASKGADYSFLARLVLDNVDQQKYFSPGMFFSVKCNEEIPFITRDAVAAASDKFPQQDDVFDQTSFFDICPKWGAKQSPASINDPVKSDIPTLVLSGEYDPITPPSYGKLAAETLSKSHYFLFPGLGHGTSVADPCPLGIAKSFLNAPTKEPDSSCIKDMSGPAFDVPLGEVKLVPFENSTFGIKGLAPDGWTEASPGVYSRTSRGDTVLLQQAAPRDAASILKLFSDQLKLSQTPAVADTRKTEHLTWSIYDLTSQGQPVDLALAEQDGTTYLVLLATPSKADHQALYDQLFLPVIDAYAPTK